jgi:hypothetical protein
LISKDEIWRIKNLLAKIIQNIKFCQYKIQILGSKFVAKFTSETIKFVIKTKFLNSKFLTKIYLYF